MQYLRARWYDPSVGRFISKDTYEGDITNPLSLNLYTYVHNNPLIYVDPTGNWCESADGNYSHPGACSSSKSTYSDDMLHDGDKIKMGKNFIGPLQTFSYSIDLRYARWKAGDVSAFEDANDSVRQQLAHMAKSDFTLTEAALWFGAGVLFGVELVEFTLAAGGVASYYAFTKGGKTNSNTPKYSDHVNKRMKEDTGPYHNFPGSFDTVILGNKPAMIRADGRSEYLVRGTVNNTTGYYHITLKDNTISHRSFIPDSDWARYSNRWDLPNIK